MPSALLVRPRSHGYGEVVALGPDGNGWHYIDFKVERVAAGESYTANTGGSETVVVFIEGSADVRCGDNVWNGVGGRRSPFDGPPQALYLPQKSSYAITARGDCEIAVSAAPARESYPARLVALQERDAHQRGTGNAQRRVYNILMDAHAASTLFITEVVTPPGHWSSYPPHKHDTDNPPHESALEELYYYRAQPPAGFAFQRVYTADGELDETVTAHDRDVVLVPRGYHVCAAAAQYTIYYLNVLAGPKHVYRMSFDPQHEWIREGWTW
jgi:5-deoxy-glucuronate isomerase